MAKYGEKVVRVGLKREQGYLYYIDKDGDISRSPQRRRKKVATLGGDA